MYLVAENMGGGTDGRPNAPSKIDSGPLRTGLSLRVRQIGAVSTMSYWVRFAQRWCWRKRKTLRKKLSHALDL